MADEQQERRVLRPVELLPDEAATLYVFAKTRMLEPDRVHALSRAFAKIEAAMEPIDVPALSAETSERKRNRK